MDKSLVIQDIEDGIRILTLNRPVALNAIDMELASRLDDSLMQAADDPNLRCLIVTGSGTRAFSAGFDIREMASFDPEEMKNAFISRDGLFLRIATHPLPIIAALNGLAHGAGALIAAACDFRVACVRSRFKVTAVGYGSANATWSLPRIVGPSHAKDILMTGREILAEEGLAIGLYNRMATDGDVVGTAISLATDFAKHPKAGVGAVKALVDASASRSPTEGWKAEHLTMLEGFETLPAHGNDVFSEFLAKRK